MIAKGMTKSELMALHRKQIKEKLGMSDMMGGMGDMSEMIDDDDIQESIDAKTQSASAPRRKDITRVLQKSASKARHDVPATDESGEGELSARQRNMMKRKAKEMVKTQAKEKEKMTLSKPPGNSRLVWFVRC